MCQGRRTVGPREIGEREAPLLKMVIFKFYNETSLPPLHPNPHLPLRQSLLYLNLNQKRSYVDHVTSVKGGRT